MTTTTAPIRATYTIRPPRRRYMRAIIRACLAALCITTTACLCAIMISAAVIALRAPAPAPAAPALNPSLHCDFFDTCSVDTSMVDDRR